MPERSGRENKAIVSRRARRVRREDPANQLPILFHILTSILSFPVSSAIPSGAGERNKFVFRSARKVHFRFLFESYIIQKKISLDPIIWYKDHQSFDMFQIKSAGIEVGFYCIRGDRYGVFPLFDPKVHIKTIGILLTAFLVIDPHVKSK